MSRTYSSSYSQVENSAEPSYRNVSGTHLERGQHPLNDFTPPRGPRTQNSYDSPDSARYSLRYDVQSPYVAKAPPPVYDPNFSPTPMKSREAARNASREVRSHDRRSKYFDEESDLTLEKSRSPRKSRYQEDESELTLEKTRSPRKSKYYEDESDLTPKKSRSPRRSKYYEDQSDFTPQTSRSPTKDHSMFYDNDSLLTPKKSRSPKRRPKYYDGDSNLSTEKRRFKDDDDDDDDMEWFFAQWSKKKKRWVLGSIIASVVVLIIIIAVAAATAKKGSSFDYTPSSAQVTNQTSFQTGGATRSNPYQSASDGNGAGKDEYTYYTGDAAHFPQSSQWVSFDDMWKSNLETFQKSCEWLDEGDNNSPEVIQTIRDAIQDRANASLVDHRFILATILQESNGCVNVGHTTSSGGVHNPGLMQSHNGHAYNPDHSEESIMQMVQDGTQGTDHGDGLVQNLNRYGDPYSAARGYNSGYIPKSGDLSEAAGATACYVSDIANRLTGWVYADSKCPGDEA